MGQLIVLVAMFALLWVFLIMPQRRRAAAQRELLSGVAVGDEILTVGGLIGHVRSAQGEELVARDRAGHAGPRRPAGGRERAHARARGQSSVEAGPAAEQDEQVRS